MKTTARATTEMKQRCCIMCGVNIFHRRITAVYCKNCLRKKQSEYNKKYQKKIRQREKHEKNLKKK